MKNIRSLLLGALSLAGLALTGCQQENNLIDPPAYSGVEVFGVSFVAEVGDGVTIYDNEEFDIASKVTVVPYTAADMSLVYSSSKDETASVDEFGLVTAHVEGTAVITARAGEQSDSFTLTVLPFHEVESVTFDAPFDADYEIIAGQSIDLSDKYAFLPDYATSPDVTWESSNKEAATIDENGNLEALAPGQTTITVTVGGVPDSFLLTVIADPDAATDIDWNEPLKSDGLLMGVLETLNVADRVTVLPASAAAKPRTYSAENEEVATISPDGTITAVGPGETTITVTSSNGLTDEFTLTVSRVLDIELDYDGAMVVPVGATNRIWGHIDVTPVPTDLKLKAVTISSLEPEIATVDQNGVIIGKSAGTTTITVAATDEPDIAKTLEVRIVEAEYYPRNAAENAATPWTMTASNVSGAGQGNSLTAALDGVYRAVAADADQTVFTMTRPGKNINGVNLSADLSGIWFVVDMKSPQVVNAFKLIHRYGVNTNRTVRFFGFDEISGSNDGSAFTTIAEMVEVADPRSPRNDAVSETTFVNDTPYQYIRFFAKTVNFCFINNMRVYPGIDRALDAAGVDVGDAQLQNDNNGNSVQLQELYLGKY